MTGVLSILSETYLIPVGQQERDLAQIMLILIKKNCSDALPEFVDRTVTRFKQACKTGKVQECSLEKLSAFSGIHPDIFQYVTRIGVFHANPEPFTAMPRGNSPTR
jgi:hypothetical protein